MGKYPINKAIKMWDNLLEVMPVAKFYGIKKGREIGVFSTWEQCKMRVDSFSKAVFKSFDNYEDAYFFVFDRYPENIGNQSKDLLEYEGIQAEVVSYIDGSYDDTLKRFSYAGLIFHNGEEIEFAHSEDTPDLLSFRNIAGELKAAMYVMDYAVKQNAKSLDIYYDYSGIEYWATKAWKTNTELTKQYAAFAQKVMENLEIRFIKVKAHSGDKYNEKVDSLAKDAIRAFKGDFHK